VAPSWLAQLFSMFDSRTSRKRWISVLDSLFACVGWTEGQAVT
jgi:hypothetical protein